MKKKHSILLGIVIAVVFTGCTGRIGTNTAQYCSEQLSAAEDELNKAKADGLGEVVQITKATSLIAAAAVQKQFERYAGCADKARRARAYIADARKN